MDAVAALEVVAGELGGGDEPHAVLHRVVIGVLGAEGGVVVRKGQSAQLPAALPSGAGGGWGQSRQNRWNEYEGRQP